MKQTPTLAIISLLIIFLINQQTHAQTPASLAAVREGNVSTHIANESAPQTRRHILPLRAGETTAGSRVTLAADAPLDDYADYRKGDQFYVLVPRAEMAELRGELAGRGFTATHLARQHGDVLLTFQLQADTEARVTQKFNRLEINFITQPANSTNDHHDAAQDTAPQTVASGNDHELIQQLLRRIEELEGQVKELKAGAAANTALPMPAAQASVPTEETSEAEKAQAVLDEHGHEGGAGPHMQIQGFADIDFRASNQKGTTNAFNLGQLDLFLTSRLSERFSVLSELIIEAQRDNTFRFEIHRLLLRYAPNDFFNVSVGRYHTAIGYYNTAYHHGSWFATAADRPFLFAFEGQGGPLPLHNTGLSATGRIPSGSLGLHYIAEIGNGRAVRSPADRSVQSAGDENNGKAFNLGLFARPDWLAGLQTGFSFYHDKLTPLNAPNVSQEIMAGHVVYRNPRYEWLNEAVFIRHAPAGSSQVFYTPGFYTQFARRFGKATPYFRYQYLNAPADDPILSATGRRNGPSAGLRYDVTTYAALKLQYNRTQRRAQRPLDEVIAQLAFTF
ncbi:MAG: hypothetical protein DMF64_08435 [Acidobacteria bacterium]|nr:MAG: hypothetical protein DMF64_08435 [Acidobacteriota bacterium]